MLSDYQVPDEIKYIAVFLTFACQLKCPYCINRAGHLRPRPHLSPERWVAGLSRLHTRANLPLTLQGGEPTLYKGFYEVVEGLPERLPLDLLTNAQFDIPEFISRVDREKFGRTAPYAPIRVSYHHATMHPMTTLDRVLRLQNAGFKVGIWVVDVPEERMHNDWFFGICRDQGIDIRWKEYLAPGHGTYRYPDAVFEKPTKVCQCKTSEILIDPAGRLFRCHADLYANRNPIGSLMDSQLPDFLASRPCSNYGQCSPCDVKTKTNYLQQPGHCSVCITDVIYKS